LSPSLPVSKRLGKGSEENKRDIEIHEKWLFYGDPPQAKACLADAHKL